MGFFDKLTNTINSTGKGVEQKAKMISGTVKLNGQIKELNEAIQEHMRRVGELYYKKQDGMCDDPEIQDLFDKITKSKKEIKSAESQIETLKGIYRCKNCGAEMRITDNYCMMCGTKREDVASMIENTTVDSEAVFTDVDEQQERTQVLEYQEDDLTEQIDEEKESEEEKGEDEIEEDSEEGEGIDPSEFEQSIGTFGKKLSEEEQEIAEEEEEKDE